MSKALVLGAAALALSAGTAWAQGYGYGYGYVNGYGYENGYAAPVADLAAPGYGYGYGYAAPVAPAQPGTTIVIVTPGPAPAYTAPPVVTGQAWFRSRSMTTHPAIGEAAGIGADGSCRSGYTLKMS